jgi:hypothetical protein
LDLFAAHSDIIVYTIPVAQFRHQHVAEIFIKSGDNPIGLLCILPIVSQKNADR